MGISVNIVSGPDRVSSRAEVSGSIEHIITDDERGTFNIGDHELKQAVAAYFGKAPNDAYVHSPTPWNDLYSTYNWRQVRTIIAPTSAEILEVTSDPEIVRTTDMQNDSSQMATFSTSITDSVQNTVSSSWSTGGTLSVGEEIEVGVEPLGMGAKSATSISYSQSWGVGGVKSTSVTVGADASLTVPLQPHQRVQVQLAASRGVMKVKVTYAASLRGQVAVNYDPAYRGHHFYALDVDAVMRAAGIQNAVVSTETIEVGYYSNAIIRVVDAGSGKVVALHSALDAVAA